MKRKVGYLLTALALTFSAGCADRESNGLKADLSKKPLRHLSARTNTIPDITSQKANLKSANQYFREGVDFYKRGRPGNPKSNAYLIKAAKMFRKANVIYEKASHKDPDNSSLLNRITECNRCLYSCNKMRTF
jgi:hypothetical protein